MNRFDSATQRGIFLFYNTFDIRLNRNSHAEIYYSNHSFPIKASLLGEPTSLIFDQNSLPLDQ